MKKRLLAALMAGAMALTMTACGGSSSGSDEESVSDPQGNQGTVLSEKRGEQGRAKP